jgi:hypothetical protein
LDSLSESEKKEEENSIFTMLKLDDGGEIEKLVQIEKERADARKCLAFLQAKLNF